MGHVIVTPNTISRCFRVLDPRGGYSVLRVIESKRVFVEAPKFLGLSGPQHGFLTCPDASLCYFRNHDANRLFSQALSAR